MAETAAQRRARLSRTVGIPGVSANRTGTVPRGDEAYYQSLLRRNAPAAAAPPPAAAPSSPAAPAYNPRADREAAGQSARAIIQGALNQYGLGALGEWAWNSYLDGMPETQIIDIELPKQEAFKTRFPAYDALAKKGRAVSAGELIQMERTMVQTMRAYGLPATFYDEPGDLAKLMINEVSPKELDDRLALAEQASLTDPRGQRLREELSNRYGMSNAQGMVTAWFIDPDRAQNLIQRQFQTAVTGAASRQAGFGSLSTEQAERVAGLGIGEQQQVAAFGELATMGEFTTSLPGGGDDAVNRDELIAAGLEGNAVAQQKVERTRSTRKAQFAGGGGYSSSQGGISGLGSASN